jgi:hypothetical protein
LSDFGGKMFAGCSIPPPADKPRCSILAGGRRVEFAR